MACGFSCASLAIPSNVVGRSSADGAVGCAEMRTCGGEMALDGKYERIVRSWSVVGGDSTTSRLNWRGGEVGLSLGYGVDKELRRRARALEEGCEDGWWLRKPDESESTSINQ